MYRFNRNKGNVQKEIKPEIEVFIQQEQEKAKNWSHQSNTLVRIWWSVAQIYQDVIDAMCN